MPITNTNKRIRWECESVRFKVAHKCFEDYGSPKSLKGKKILGEDFFSNHLTKSKSEGCVCKSWEPLFVYMIMDQKPSLLQTFIVISFNYSYRLKSDFC